MLYTSCLFDKIKKTVQYSIVIKKMLLIKINFISDYEIIYYIDLSLKFLVFSSTKYEKNMVNIGIGTYNIL